MKYGLIGGSLGHSYSKEIHEALGRYEYELFTMTLPQMRAFVQKGQFGGLNITIPHKQEAAALCDEVTPLAREIGAVNTLYWSDAKGAAGPSGNGCWGERRLVGHNTDYEGFLYGAQRAGIGFQGKTVLILGSGGTSRTVCKAAADSGAARILIASRQPQSAGSFGQSRLESEKAAARRAGPNGPVRSRSEESSPGQAETGQTQQAEFAGQAGTDGKAPGIFCISYQQLAARAKEIQILINTTPVGTYPGNLERLVDLADFPACEAVLDVIYNPFKTALLLDAERRGLPFSNGLPMLVAQATAAAGYFLGNPGAFEDQNESILEKLTGSMENLILIGMPGSGKSTLGRLLAQERNKPFVDMDDVLAQQAGCSIPELFAREGEAGFRARETEVAKKLGRDRGQIIATGGGAVLRKENLDALRQNGRLIHVTRPLDQLAVEGRPLSKDLEALREMEKKRLPVYQAAADMTFDNQGPLTPDKLKLIP